MLEAISSFLKFFFSFSYYMIWQNYLKVHRVYVQTYNYWANLHYFSMSNRSILAQYGKVMFIANHVNRSTTCDKIANEHDEALFYLFVFQRHNNYDHKFIGVNQGKENGNLS